MKKRGLFALFLSFALLLTGCTSDRSGDAENAAETGANSADMFTDRDFEIGYDESESIAVWLSGSGASCDSGAVQISGSTVTITDEGTYILSGTLDDGMVVVDAERTDKLQLVLDGVDIHSETSAALYIRQADKVFLTLAADSVNTLSNGGQFTAIDENNIDAVIFSKDDLTLNGNGSLTIASPAGHGVVSKDDLVLTGGAYDITAASHGLSGKDSVRIAAGSFTIVSGKDGVHAENADDSSLGFLYIAGGAFEITAAGDGMSAGSDAQIENGAFSIQAGGAVDYESDATITGGIFVAVGASQMAQNFGSASTQGAMMVSVGSQQAGSTVELTDSAGQTLVSWTVEQAFDSVMISCPEIVQGATYTLTVGGSGMQITMDSLIYGAGGGMGAADGRGDMGGKGDMFGFGGRP